MSKVAERLKELRTDRGLTLKQLSSDLSINIQTYANYEHGIRELPIDTLIVICNYYDVTADYLIGRTDY